MIGAYWGQKFNENAMAMMDDYNRLTAQFQQKYGVGHADGMTDDEREDVVVQQVIDMARGGHFAAMEAPDLLLADIRRFFGGLEVS